MKRKNKGFTLIEVLVAAAISTLVLVGLWSLVSLSFRAGSKADERLKTGQAFLLLNERLNKDFSRLHVSPQYGIQVKEKGLTFWTSKGLDENNFELEVQRVSYEFSKETGRVRRMVGTGSWDKLPGKFDEVTYIAKGSLQSGMVIQFAADGFFATLPLTTLISRQRHKDWICRVEPVS